MFKILSKVTMPFHNYLLCSDLGSIKPASPPPLPALPPPPSPKRVLTWKEAEVRLFDPSQPPAYLTSPPSPKRVLTWKEDEVRLFDPSQPPAYLTSPPSPKRVLTWKEDEVRLFDPSQPPAYLTSPPVKIVGGTHSGKKAFFIKKTKKRVMVSIEGVGERYLSPKNIKF